MAKDAARRFSAAQERRRNQDAAVALGLPTQRTLPELLERRHADLSPRWTKKYAKSRELRRAFWLDKLGGVSLAGLNAAVVERIAREAQGDKSDRWRQDVLRYLVDSFIYAERKLKWIEPRDNLSAVEIPSARGTSRPYTAAEARKLLPALWATPVAGWMGVVALQTGRRLSAIRTLTDECVTVAGEWTYIDFPGETDKARNTGTAAVYGLPERTDWTIPSEGLCNDWIHEGEQRAGVEHMRGRGWHGLKRLYATLTTDLPGADKQSGTRRETLEGHYRQDLMAPKREVAREVARLCPAPRTPMA